MADVNEAQIPVRSERRRPAIAPKVLVPLGVGGLLGFLFAAHQFPTNSHTLQAVAVVWFFAAGLLRILLDRRGER
jgi:hypothetical protein